jgi:hypothetical protein
MATVLVSDPLADRRFTMYLLECPSTCTCTCTRVIIDPQGPFESLSALLPNLLHKDHLQSEMADCQVHFNRTAQGIYQNRDGQIEIYSVCSCKPVAAAVQINLDFTITRHMIGRSMVGVNKAPAKTKEVRQDQ